MKITHRQIDPLIQCLRNAAHNRPDFLRFRSDHFVELFSRVQFRRFLVLHFTVANRELLDDLVVVPAERQTHLVLG